MELDMQKVAEYIYARLIEQGVTVSVENISVILDLEFQYLAENGFVEMGEEK